MSARDLSDGLQRSSRTVGKEGGGGPEHALEVLHDVWLLPKHSTGMGWDQHQIAQGPNCEEHYIIMSLVVPHCQCLAPTAFRSGH